MVGDALKHDGWKPRLELIDTGAELLLGMVLTAGAVEYTDDSWRGLNTVKGRERIIGSLMRHLNAYRLEHRDNVAIDKQFGLPHSGHLLACAMFLAAMDVENLESDGLWGSVMLHWKDALKDLFAERNAETQKEAVNQATPTKGSRCSGGDGPSQADGALARMFVSTGPSRKGFVV